MAERPPNTFEQAQTFSLKMSEDGVGNASTVSCCHERTTRCDQDRRSKRSSQRRESVIKSNTTTTSSDLNDDYAAIAQLMKDLSCQVGSFTNHMNDMVDSVSDYDSLVVLWDGLSSSSQQQPLSPSSTAERRRATPTGGSSSSDAAIMSSTTNGRSSEEIQHQEYAEDLVLGDEGEDQDDKLIFL